MIGVGQVGNGSIPHAPEEQGGDDVQGPLIDGARRVVRLHSGRLTEPDECADIEAESDVVGDGVAQVDRQRSSSMPIDHRTQHPFRFGECVIPGNRHVLPVGPLHQRQSEPVRVVVYLP